MSNTKTNTKDSSIKIEESKPVDQQFIKHVESGIIYHVCPGKTNDVVLARLKNKYVSYKLIDIKQQIVNGVICEPNQHEVKAFLEKDKLYFQELSYKLMKRIMYTQLLLELDDELKEDFCDDNYIRNILEKSEKQFLRLVKETYPKMYHIDKDMLFTFLKNIEDCMAKISKIMPHEFIFLSTAIDEYFADPSKFTPATISIDRVDSDLMEKI